MPRQQLTTHQVHRKCLCRFMAWKNGEECDHRTAQFSQEQLLEIEPFHVVRCVRLLAHGTETPEHNARPTRRRSSGLEFVKKATSHFVPNQNAKWNVETLSGNPTMSVAVNNLIKEVKEEEVRKRGEKPGAKRDMKRPEHRKTLRTLEACPDRDFIRKCRTPAMMKLQFHIVGRADDISNLETLDLRSHEKFKAFSPQTKVSWSKNVMEERSCPDQMLLGAMDPDFCVLLSLGCHSESRLSTLTPDGRRFLFGDSDEDDEATRINDRCQRHPRDVWKKNEDMKHPISQVQGSIGTHSLRKFPWAAEHRITQEHIETRGRWKGGRNGRAVNRCVNVEQLPTDGSVAATLCVGGPVKHESRTGSGLTHHFLMTHVAPGIKSFHTDPSNKTGEALAMPVLWCAFQSGLEHMLLPEIRARIRNAHEAIRPDDFHADWNPIVNVGITCIRNRNKRTTESPRTASSKKQEQ